MNKTSCKKIECGEFGRKAEIRFRLANLFDAKKLAEIHFLCSKIQPDGFMYKLGRRFIIEYYRVLLRERMTVIVCADAQDHGIIGFVSASLESKEELLALKKANLRLLFTSLPALIHQPKLLKEVYSRNRSLSAFPIGKGYVSSSGARISYWCWLPKYKKSSKSVILLQTLLKIFADLGASTILLEVDCANQKVLMTHRLLGAKTINKFTTNDKRKRIIMEYIL